MDRKEYLQALEKIGMGQSQAGEFFVKNPVTGRRWALTTYNGPPRPVAMLMRLMVALKLTPDKVTSLIGDKDPKRERKDGPKEFGPYGDPNRNKGGAPALYSFSEMQPGDVVYGDAEKFCGAARQHARRHGWKVATQKDGERWRVERIE